MVAFIFAFGTILMLNGAIRAKEQYDASHPPGQVDARDSETYPSLGRAQDAFPSYGP